MLNRYKLLPSSIWNIGVIETWLSKMADKGLFIENFGRFFTKFTKGEPKTTHYRIDVIPAKTDEELEEKINKYKTSGWKYVNTYMNFHIFSSPHEFNSNDVYNITEEQAKLLKPQYKKNIKDILIYLLIFFALGILPSFFIKIDLYTYLLKLSILDVLASFILIIGFLYQVYEALLIRKLIKHLEQGLPIQHSCNWKLRSRFSIFYKAAFFIVVVLFFLLPYKHFFTDNYTVIEYNLEKVPIVTLKDITTIKSKDDAINLKAPDMASVFSQNTLLMPLNYETSQEYRQYIKLHTYKPMSLKSKAYQLRFESIVDNYLAELIDEESEIYEFTPIPINTEHYKGFDILKVYKIQDTYFIYASKDTGILTVSYQYDDDIDSVIKAMEKKITLLINTVSKS